MNFQLKLFNFTIVENYFYSYLINSKKSKEAKDNKMKNV